MISGRVLDVTALTDYGLGRHYVRALVGAAHRSQALVLAVPAAALAEARSRLPRQGRRRLSELRTLTPVVVDGLSAEVADRVGDLIGQAKSRPAADALAAGHVVFAAKTRDWPVMTAAPERLWAVDDTLDIERLP